jgi:hypothetical protein
MLVLVKVDEFLTVMYCFVCLYISSLCFEFLDGSESGLKQDEYDASVATLQSLAATLDADCMLLRQRKVEEGVTGQYLVRRRVDQQDFLEIR